MFLLLVILEVQGVGYDAFLQAEAKKYETCDGYENLKVAAAVLAAQSAKSELESFAKAAKHWQSPLDFKKEKSMFLDLFKKWKVAVVEMGNMRGSLLRLKHDTRKECRDAKRSWHENRTKWQTWFERSVLGGMSSALARIFSDLIYQLAKAAMTVGVDAMYRMKELTYQDGDDLDIIFSEPVFIKAVKPDDEISMLVTIWHQAVAKFVKEHGAAIYARKEAQTRKILTEGLGSTCGTLDLAADKIFEVNGDKQLGIDQFKVVEGVKEIIITQRALYVDSPGLAIRGHSHFLKLNVGKALVCMISREQFLKHDDIKLWFKQADSKDIERNVGTYMEAGDCVFCPPGWFPIIMGLPMDTDTKSEVPKLCSRGVKAHGKKKQSAKMCDETFSYTISLLMQPTKVKDLSSDLRRKLAALWVSVAPQLPEGLKGVQGVKDYIGALSATT